MASTAFTQIFPRLKPVIGCVHLLPLPGAPRYDGSLQKIYDRALQEAALLEKHDVDGIIIGNSGDATVYPDNVPAETIAAITAVSREIVNAVSLPIGINVLRNDGPAAMAVATAIGAQFIRINVHMGAMVTDQGMVQGRSYETMRLKQNLKSDVAVLADVAVKHAAPVAPRDIELEVDDLVERGLVDAVITSGDRTGLAVNPETAKRIKTSLTLPLLIGSGLTPENMNTLVPLTDGFIVGSYFKVDGHADNPMDEHRLARFMTALNQVRNI